MKQFDNAYGYDPTKSSVFNFYGLNRTRRTSKGEFSDMENMSTLEYPCAAPRGKRLKVVNDIGNVQAVCPPLINNTQEIAGFTGIANEKFYYNGRVVSEDYTLRSDWDWDAVIMGDMYIINGVSKDQTENILYSYNPSTDKFITMGGYMDNLILYASKDSSGNYLTPINKKYTTVDEYSVTLNDNTTIKGSDYYDKYFDKGSTALGKNNIFSKQFAVGDEIIISHFPTIAENTGQLFTYHISNDKLIAQSELSYEENNTVDSDVIINPEEIEDHIPVHAIVKSFTTTQVTSGVYNHKMYLTLYNKNDDVIDFTNMGSSSSLPIYCMGVKLALKKPALSQICTHNARIFGTHTSGKFIYGSTMDVLYDFSETSIHEHMAARLGDFTPGTFTGICEYGSMLVAFKEQSITIVGGNTPANYYTDVINGIGCIDRRSIAVTQNGVIFLSHNGFYIFSGNVPQCISLKLNTKYKSAVAGFDGEIYYVSAVKSNTGERELLTFDLQRSIWHKQDDLDVLGYFRFKGKFFIVHKDEDISYISETNSSDENAPSVQWSFTSVPYHDNTLDLKALENLHFRVELEKGAYFLVYSRCDDGEYKLRAKYTEPGMNVIPCPIKTEMGHVYQYKIVGGGNVVFFEIETDKAFGGRDTRPKNSMVDYVQERKSDKSEFDLL